MSVRKGYIYALLLSLGLLFWTEAWEAWQETPPPVEQTTAKEVAAVTPWHSAEAVYECAIQAQALQLDIVSIHVAADTLQGSIDIQGERKKLQEFYTWLESEGRFRAILSVQLKTEDDAHSRLNVSYQL